MNLPEISIKRPVFAWMLMIGLILFGWISFRMMGVSVLPDVDFPVISISLTYDGAAPEIIETDIVDVVEDAVMTIQGVRGVSSHARHGTAMVSVEFDLGRNIDAALQDVQSKLAQAQRDLPREMDPPIVTKTNPEDQPILWLTVSWDGHSQIELMKHVRDKIKDKFTTVSGVGEVFLGGYVEPNLRVWVSRDKLARYELTMGDILQSLRNEHSELPAGEITTPRLEYNVRTMGEARSIDDFSRIAVNERGGRPNYVPVYLKQVARVEEGLADVRRISRFNSKPAVGLGIRKQRGSNAVEVAKAIKKKIAELQNQLPQGMGLDVNFDTTKFIEDSVSELSFTLFLSALLTGLVCWLFLGSWTSTLNVLLAMPTSIMGAFIILYFAGFTLNTFTLLGLSLAVGIVVDDAIMVLENIIRHKESGKPRFIAALDGSKEIMFAAVAATVAIVAIFLPVAFMSGVIGKFFFQFGVTMTATVLFSLLEALTLTPMRCSQLLESGARRGLGKLTDSVFKKMAGVYQKCLVFTLSNRWKILMASVLVFCVSLFITKTLNKEFVPVQDQGFFLIRLQMPIDSSLAYSDVKFAEVEKFLASRNEVKRYFSAVGGMGGGEVNSGMILV
ncbi:MAG: efflux RND transporter permease subunit, partial [Bdellovibrionota bacterium]